MTVGSRRVVHTRHLQFPVRTWGPETGLPVVLLHGFPQTATCWTFVGETLGELGYWAVAPDQRGYSMTARPTEVADYATSELVADVLGIADALGIDTFHLAGHDWGASLAWILAAENPERVMSLTAVSVPHLAAFGRALLLDEDQRERSRYIAMFRRTGIAEDHFTAHDAAELRGLFGDQVPASHIDHYVDTLLEPGAMTAALNWYRAMRSDLAETGPVSVPTTFVWSDQDPSIGRVAAAACSDYVDATFASLMLSGVDHWIPEAAPGALTDAIVGRLGPLNHNP